MWSQYDFEEIEDLHFEASENYRNSHIHKKEAQTLLISAHNLHDFDQKAVHTFGSIIGDEHKMQLLYLRRGVQGLFSVYWLNKHHLYSAGYGRVRFLFELYLVVRQFNRDKKKTRDKWREFRQDLQENDYKPHETLPMTEYVSGKRRQLKGDLEKDEPTYGEVFDRISNRGSHPNTMESSYNDGWWTKESERDLLRFGLVFSYALAAQYIRTFEDTRIARSVREDMDDVIVQTLLAFGQLPKFLEEDLRFGSLT